MTDRIPVTVLTGDLGAGKTTLLNRILSDAHGRRYAVLVNEFGEIGIDNDLIVGAGQGLFELANGCVCCSVRGDLVRTLHGLLASRPAIDAILVETTGLADPTPVAQTFLDDDILQVETELDSVTTVVDAKHILARLTDSREAAAQVAFADHIVLNKTDLVSAEALSAIEARLGALNPMASIRRAQRCDVDPATILDHGGFTLERIAALTHGATASASCPDHHLPGHLGHPHDHHHDHGITSVSLSTPAPIDADRFTRWLNELVADRGVDILRAKGIVAIAGDDRRLVLQVVQSLLEGDFQRPWLSDEPRLSRLIFIGRRLDAAELERGLMACAVAET